MCRSLGSTWRSRVLVSQLFTGTKNPLDKWKSPHSVSRIFGFEFEQQVVRFGFVSDAGHVFSVWQPALNQRAWLRHHHEGFIEEMARTT